MKCDVFCYLSCCDLSILFPINNHVQSGKLHDFPPQQVEILLLQGHLPQRIQSHQGTSHVHSHLASPLLPKTHQGLPHQRLTTHYSEESKPSLGGVDLPADDSTWLSAKYLLNQTAKGRQIVSYTEQNIKTECTQLHIQPSSSRRTIARPWPRPTSTTFPSSWM